MKLTAYDLDRKSPAALITARRRPTGRTPMPAAERTRRREIARQALTAFPSMSALARHLGLPSGTVSEWLTDRRPVPARHVDTLERIAGGEA